MVEHAIGLIKNSTEAVTTVGLPVATRAPGGKVWRRCKSRMREFSSSVRVMWNRVRVLLVVSNSE
jgi:hypothetical protein